jgi:branched-chain amino acid aminotransferase
VISTPALTEGCVSGIMRKNILQELKKMDYIIKEEALTMDNLEEADEVFLTNSIYNIRWVQRVNKKNYSNTITHKIYLAVIPTIS